MLLTFSSNNKDDNGYNQRKKNYSSNNSSNNRSCYRTRWICFQKKQRFSGCWRTACHVYRESNSILSDIHVVVGTVRNPRRQNLKNINVLISFIFKVAKRLRNRSLYICILFCSLWKIKNSQLLITVSDKVFLPCLFLF